MEDFTGLWFDCEGADTTTSVEQCTCEKECATFLKPMTSYSGDTLERLQNGELVNYNKEIRLLRSLHAIYLTGGLQQLSSGYVSLDASRPWICYWIIHALYLLDREPKYLYSRVVSTLSHMQNRYGGFGGGPGQITHGAPNYAAVLTLCIIGTEEALAAVNRPAMYKHFLSLKDKSGGFAIHTEGEVDSRGTYTIVAIARVLNMLTPELTEGVADFLVQCQTYEGGFGGEPSNEAHGGYNFCALAALIILNSAQRCDMAAQERWLLRRQVRLEGGFQGRTNKLVDSCYSFWQGAALAMCEIVRNGGSDVYDMEQYLAHAASKTAATQPANSSDAKQADHISADGEIGMELDLSELDLPEAKRIKKVDDTSGNLPFNQNALQRYILHCAQNLEGGGMRDKPGKSRDFYHSCYALSGLSVSQSCITTRVRSDALAEGVVGGSLSPGAGEPSDVPELDALPEIELDWSGAQVTTSKSCRATALLTRVPLSPPLCDRYTETRTTSWSRPPRCSTSACVDSARRWSTTADNLVGMRRCCGCSTTPLELQKFHLCCSSE
jgi:protein farnesyltransferase subunit beta